MQPKQSWINAGWFITAVLTVGAVALVLHSNRAQRTADDLVVRTLQVERSLHQLQGAMSSINSAVRGYLISRNEAWLSSVDELTGTANGELVTVRRLTSDNASHQERLTQLVAAVEQNLGWCETLVRTAHEKNFAEAQSQVPDSRTSLTTIRRLVTEMLGIEEASLEARRQDATRLAGLSLRVELVLILAVFVQLGASAWLVRGRVAALAREQELVRRTNDYASSIVATLREPVVVLDPELRVRMANRAFYETFHAAPALTEGRLVTELSGGPWSIPGLMNFLQQTVELHTEFNDFRVQIEIPGRGKQDFVLNVRNVRQPGREHEELIVLAMQPDVPEKSPGRSPGV
jgi:CHASE3 domain sensor protein